MSDTTTLARLSTGVPGLDRILAGGLFAGGLYIVEGPSGAGKTILANQISFHHVRQQNSVVYYTLLSETHDRLFAFLSTLGFFDTALIGEQLTFLGGFPILEAEGMAGVLRSLRETLSRRQPSLLVVDGVVSIEDRAPDDTAFRKFLHELQVVATLFRCTILLLTNTEASRRLDTEHTMVDGILELAAPVVRLKPQRTIEVVKFRGAGQLRGTHSMDIGAGGVVVWPRIETLLTPVARKPRPTVRRAFGVAGLDRAIGGGVPAASNTMLMGPSGIGKTVLGLHFVGAGAANDEAALFFSFYEQEEELIVKADRLGIDLRGPTPKGKVSFVWQSSVEGSVDRIGSRLVTAFNDCRPTRVFIDGMHGFQMTSEPEERIQDFFAALTDYFIAAGATVLFTLETPELLGEPAIRVPFPNASRMCQNILVLRYAEYRGQLRRVFTVVKVRDSEIDPTLREMTIGERGVIVGDRIAGADGPLGGQLRHAGRDDEGAPRG